MSFDFLFPFPQFRWNLSQLLSLDGRCGKHRGVDVHVGTLLQITSIRSGRICCDQGINPQNRERGLVSPDSILISIVKCETKALNLFEKGGGYVYNKTIVEMNEEIRIFLFGSFYCLLMIIFLSCFLNILNKMWSSDHSNDLEEWAKVLRWKVYWTTEKFKNK